MKRTQVMSVILVLLFLTACKTQQLPETEEQKEIVIYEFYGKGCPHCKNLNTWLEAEIKPKYPELTVIQYEVYSNSTNNKLFSKVAEAYGTKAGGVPTVFIGEKRIVGFGETTKGQIVAEIESCLNMLCSSPAAELLR